MKTAETNQIFQQTFEYLAQVGSGSYSPFVKAIPENVSVGGSLAPVTGVMPALLPMTIATSDVTGERRVEFTMLVNPANVNHGKTNSTYSSYTRSGWVTQLWGPNQDLLTGTGSSVAFMVEGEGLTSFLRRRSIGFQNFMALMKTYRNNGYMLIDPTKLNTLTRVISLVHGIEITYDNQVMMGHFNNFTLDENADNPYTFNYNFEFVCSTLSNDYAEVRGHFKQIPVGIEKTENADTPVLMSDLLGTEKTDLSAFDSAIGFLEAE
jgi:hypothetical protein